MSDIPWMVKTFVHLFIANTREAKTKHIAYLNFGTFSFAFQSGTGEFGLIIGRPTAVSIFSLFQDVCMMSLLDNLRS